MGGSDGVEVVGREGEDVHLCENAGFVVLSIVIVIILE